MLKDVKTLFDELPEDQRRQIEQEADELNRRYVWLRELREIRHITQEQMAALLGVTQSTVSKTENMDDVRLKTLRRYINAMGGDLRITARFGDREEELYRSNAAE